MTDTPDTPKRRRGQRGPKAVRPPNAVITEALRASSGLILPAAKRIKVERHVLARWVAEDPELQAVQAESKEALADVAESAFIQRALDKSDPASQNFLMLLLRNLGRSAPPPPSAAPSAAPVVIHISPYRKRDGDE